jgi:hypothetical protein
MCSEESILYALASSVLSRFLDVLILLCGDTDSGLNLNSVSLNSLLSVLDGLRI